MNALVKHPTYTLLCQYNWDVTHCQFKDPKTLVQWRTTYANVGTRTPTTLREEDFGFTAVGFLGFVTVHSCTGNWIISRRQSAADNLQCSCMCIGRNKIHEEAYVLKMTRHLLG